MFSAILILFVLTFVQKAIPFFNLSLIFLLYWTLRVREKDTLSLALISSLFYDLFNNLTLGSSLLGTTVILALVLVYRRLVSQISLPAFIVIAIVGSFLWEQIVAAVNRFF